MAVKTNQELADQISALLTANGAGAITGPLLRSLMQDINDSMATDAELTASLEGYVQGGNGIDAIVKLTQAEYDAIAAPSATTLYVIEE